MSTEDPATSEDDLLFTGEADGEEVDDATDGQVHVYDFRKPARISKDRHRSLTAMYGLLAKAIESWTAGRVRERLEVEMQSIEQLSFGEFVTELPSPCASYLVDMPGDGRQAVIDFGLEFAYYLTDRLLGGVGRHEVPARPLTSMERSVVRIVAEKISHQLTDVWKDYVQLDLQVSGFESIPEMLRVANREDPVLVTRMLVTSGDMSSVLVMCLPFNTVEKFFTGTTTRRPEEPQGSPEQRLLDRELIETTVRDSRIILGARLPEFTVSMRELSRLRPGGILPTGLGIESELELFAAGQRRFVGLPGRVGQHLAVRIADRARPEPEDLIAPGRQALEATA